MTPFLLRLRHSLTHSHTGQRSSCQVMLLSAYFETRLWARCGRQRIWCCLEAPLLPPARSSAAMRAQTRCPFDPRNGLHWTWAPSSWYVRWQSRTVCVCVCVLIGRLSHVLVPPARVQGHGHRDLASPRVQ